MGDSSAYALEAKQVIKTYGSGSAAVHALSDVSVDIRHNEFFTLLGPSGCGKTTLLRLFAGFEGVTEGEILLYGEKIAGLPPNQRPINTVFQHYALFPHMTVAENISYGLKRLKKPQSHIDSTVKEMLALVHMEEFADRKPNQMSGGQMQRVALARALAPQPKVLLLDEPLSALDLKLRQAMREELQRLQRETGITFVFVTHDQDEALSMSDRIAVMSKGKVQQIGTPEDIYIRPANRFVADFIGDTNLIDTTIESTGDGRTRYLTTGKLPLEISQSSGHQTGDSVTLNIRPESIVMVDPNGSDKPVTTATLSSKMFIGSTSLYSLKLDDGTMLKARYSNRQINDQRNLAEGDKVGISFTADAIAELTA